METTSTGWTPTLPGVRVGPVRLRGEWRGLKTWLLGVVYWHQVPPPPNANYCHPSGTSITLHFGPWSVAASW